MYVSGARRHPHYLLAEHQTIKCNKMPRQSKKRKAAKSAAERSIAQRKRKGNILHVSNVSDTKKNGEPLLNVCANCHRCDRAGELDLGICSLDSSCSRGRKWILVDDDSWHSAKNEDGVVKVRLCIHCKRYAQGDGPKLNTKWDVVWPAFFWNFLRSKAVHNKIGTKAWDVIPEAWRHWWMASYNRAHGGNLGVTIKYPPAVTRDVTSLRNRSLGVIQRLKLFELEKEWCSCLNGGIRCPWGCHEYFHRAAGLPIDLVIGRIFDISPKDMKYVTMNPVQMMEMKVAGIREDFLSASSTIDDCLLMNPE